MGRYLDSVIVAPVTSTVPGVSTEVELGPEDGIRHPSVANLDNVQLLSKRQLVRPVGNVRPATVRALCRALGRATACASTHAHAIAAMLPARSGRRWHQGWDERNAGARAPARARRSWQPPGARSR